MYVKEVVSSPCPDDLDRQHDRRVRACRDTHCRANCRCPAAAEPTAATATAATATTAAPATEPQPTATAAAATIKPTVRAGTPDRLILATTTSTQDSGLLEYLLPDFEKEFNTKVDVIAVGTGQALQLGKDGNADVLLVHARAQEDAFMEAGDGTRREDVMYNDFVIVGPASDPAKIKGMTTAVDAFKKIAEAGAAGMPSLSHAVTNRAPTPKNWPSGNPPRSRRKAIGMSPPGRAWAKC